MTEFIPAAKPLIGEDERIAVDRVLRSGMLAQGPEVAAFEREFAEHFQLNRTCVAVNSGTSGLHLGLLAAGVRPGDEVIVPSFTFAATANSVALAGATPVFADIDPASFCLDPASVEAAIADRTVGIMPVHLYGHPADMPALQALAAQYGLQIFEDAAQAHGASIHGTPVGSFGSFAMFSLYPTKNMTSGEGGMVSVANSDIERLMRLYRNQGMQRQYENEVVGFNSRMTDIHAAIGRAQLTKIDAIITGERGTFVADTLSADLTFVADTLSADLTFYANGSVPTAWSGIAQFRGVSEGDVIRYAIAKPEPLRVEHENFRDAVLGKDADIVTMEQGLATVLVAEAMIESANTGATIDLRVRV